MLFRDRVDAGRKLAHPLAAYAGADPVVLGLPRGGVVVAAEVARELHAPLDAILVRKLGVPDQPELAVGAVGEDGVLVVNHDVLATSRLSPEELRSLEAVGRAELEERARQLRGHAPRLSLTGRVALVVDDGVATGATARAACQVARAHGARAVVLAVPVAASRTAVELRRDVDDLVCLDHPYPFWAVGQVYRNFGQVPDAEVVALLDRARTATAAAEAAEPEPTGRPRDVEVTVPGATLPGILDVPPRPLGLVAFAHGSGSSRLSPRNARVARILREAGLGTLLLDLLTPTEAADRSLVFDIDLLSARLAAACRWLRRQPGCRSLPLGLFGASTGAAAALAAAADPLVDASAVVSRGGRPDLAGGHLTHVRAPTLLVVGGRDDAVLQLNRQAQARLSAGSLVVVPGATHLFEEPGALEHVAALARDWFIAHMAPGGHGLTATSGAG